jgi:hypothetical protein
LAGPVFQDTQADYGPGYFHWQLREPLIAAAVPKPAVRARLTLLFRMPDQIVPDHVCSSA